MKDTPNDAAGELRQKLADIVFGYNGVSVGAPANSTVLIDELQELFAAHQRQLVEKIEGEIPKDKGCTHHISMQNHCDECLGANAAADEIRTIIAHKKKEIS